MNVIVTGGGGFLGQRLLRRLAQRGRLTGTGGREEAIGRILSVDLTQPPGLLVHDLVEYVRGNIEALDFTGRVLGTDTSVVFHLAAAPSALTETDFDAGIAANVDATRALLEACRLQRRRPRLVFVSSVAVYDLSGARLVADTTQALPRSSYATQKLIGELLVSEYSRRGFIDGRVLRLPSLVVRPAAASEGPLAFASALIRESMTGHAVACPVEADAALWLSSADAAVDALVHAHELPESAWGEVRTVNAPGVTVTVGELLGAVEAVGGLAARQRVNFEIDPELSRRVHSFPAHFATDRALALGFKADPDALSLVRGYIAERIGLARH